MLIRSVASFGHIRNPRPNKRSLCLGQLATVEIDGQDVAVGICSRIRHKDRFATTVKTCCVTIAACSWDKPFPKFREGSKSVLAPCGIFATRAATSADAVR
jgi:hypothetical protein